MGTTLFLGTDGSEGFRQNGGYSRWQARVKTVFGPDTQRPVDAFINWTQRDADEFYTWLSEDQPLEVEPEDFTEGKAILDRGMAAYSRTGEFALSEEDGEALKALGEKYGLSEENLEEWSSSN